MASRREYEQREKRRESARHWAEQQIEPKRTSARTWARECDELDKKRRAEAQAKRAQRKAATPPRRRSTTPTNYKPAAFYVPFDLDPDILPAAHLPYAYYFLNLIHWRTCCWRSNAAGFVQLLYRLLTRIIPRNVLRAIKKTLIDQKVIECDRQIARGKALGYRLTPEYRKTCRIVCTDDALNRKIARVYCKEDLSLLPVHRWQKAKLDLIAFDMEKAAAIIARKKPEKGSTAEYRQQRMDNCRRIANKDFWFNHDEFGRVHTSMTSLEADLRCCLSARGHDGELHSLVNIDLKNSQPLIFGIFAARQFYSSKMARSRLLNKSFGDRMQPYCTQAVHEMAEHGAVELPPDLEEYVRVCEKGEFYESLMTDEEKAKGEKARRRFKTRFYRVLFGRNQSRSRFRNQTKHRFREVYPSAAEVLHALKQRNYRHSSHVLQNYESTMFIGVICGRIMRERPDTVVFTIHDSILTTPDDVEYVRRVIQDEFAKLGVHPSLSEERYDDPA